MQDRWAIGYRKGSISPDSPSKRDFSDATWIHPPPGRIFADPFLTIWQKEPWIFFEDYDGLRGHIAASPLLNFEARPALRLDWHLSYPFLIESGGEIFCIPEQHEAQEVALYRCQKFPDVWKKETVLLDGFAGVDPTVIWSDGLWWMWVGEQSRRARDNTFLFWAPALTGPWREHRQSPVIQQTDLARPGGLPWRSPNGTSWMRPAQNRTRTYGGGLLVYQVDRLDPEFYQETEWTRWEPLPDWPYPDGLHHLCMSGGWTVWDAKRFVEEL